MKRFKDILFVADPQIEDGAALQRAATLAENNQAGLTVVSVIEDVPARDTARAHGVSSQTLRSAMIEERLQLLDTLIQPLGERVRMSAKVLTGTSFLEIIREVLRHGRDLVVKAAEGSGLLARLFGSTDMALLRKCPCPVWLTNQEQPETYKRILAAVDFDEFEEKGHKDTLNRKILEMATSLALSEGSELHIVHVWDALGESAVRSRSIGISQAQMDAYVGNVEQSHRRWLDGLLAALGTGVGKDALDYANPQVRLRRGSARDMIPACANELQAELLIMGTLARTGVAGLVMGNTAETILQRVNCSVLAMKPEGFVTPVTLDEN